MKARVWRDERTGMFRYEVRGGYMRAAGIRRTWRAALDQALGDGRKYCARVAELVAWADSRRDGEQGYERAA